MIISHKQATNKDKKTNKNMFKVFVIYYWWVFIAKTGNCQSSAGDSMQYFMKPTVLTNISHIKCGKTWKVLWY